MKIEPIPTPPFNEQMYSYGESYWSVARLAKLAEKLEVFEVPVLHLMLDAEIEPCNLRQLAGEVIAVNRADMSKPIILDELGCIMDGRHRIVHAIVNGIETVKAVRFAENPTPCRIVED